MLLLRGLAAALVFTMHSGIVFGNNFKLGGSPFAWVVLSPAWLGMAMFFTLSGYLMGKGFYDRKYDESLPGVGLYLRNRFLRIVPLTFTVALLIVVLQAPGFLVHSGLSRFLVVRVGSFTFNGVNGPEGLGAFWSLSTEWQFYLIVPLVFVLAKLILQRGRLLRLGTLTAVVIAGGICIRWYVWSRHGGFAGWGQWIYTPLYTNLDIFLLGFLANWWRPHFKTVSTLMARVWPVVLLLVCLGYSYVAYRALILGQTGWQAVFTLFLPSATALLLMPVIIGMESLNLREAVRFRHRRRTATVLYWVGALTFPVYLIHSSILFAIEQRIPRTRMRCDWLLD